MSGDNLDERFWSEAVVSVAADDERLNRSLGSIICNLSFGEGADYGDLKEYLFNRYGLSSERDFEATFDLCEDRILAKVYGREA